MSYGIEFRNDSGFLLIDGESSNYSLLASGTVAAGTAVTFPTAIGAPLIFIRFNASTYYVRVSILTVNSVTFQVWNSPANEIDATMVGGDVEYMVFGVASSLIPSSGYGIHIFNSSSALVFDANTKVPRIKQVVTVPALPRFADAFRNPKNVISHTQGTSPWMLANFTRNVYGYHFIQEYPQPTSDLMVCAIRADVSGFGNRIIVQAVKKGIQVGSQGSQWPSAPIPIALIP